MMQRYKIYPIAIWWAPRKKNGEGNRKSFAPLFLNSHLIYFYFLSYINQLIISFCVRVITSGISVASDSVTWPVVLQAAPGPRCRGAAAPEERWSQCCRLLQKGWLVVVFVLFWLSRVLTRHRRWVLRSSVSEGEGQWGGWGEGGGGRGRVCGPLPAEQVASAQSHKVDLAGASGPNGGKEYLQRRQTDGDFTAWYSHTHVLFSRAVWISTQEALKDNSSQTPSAF